MIDYNAMEPVELTAVEGDNLSYFAPFVPETLQGRLLTDPMTMSMGAVVDGTACGAVVFAVEEPTVQLLSIAVAPGYRRRHIGTTLFCEMVDFLELSGEFDVDLVRASYPDRGDGVGEFFSSLNCSLEIDSPVSIAVPLQALRTRKFGSTEATSPPGYAYLPLRELSPYHLSQLNTLLDDDGANFTGLPVGPDTADGRVSTACYQKEKPVGCICFAGDPGGEIMLTVFCIARHSPEFVYGLLHHALEQLNRWGTDGTVVRIPLVQPSAFRLANTLLGNLGEVYETLCHAQFPLRVLEPIPTRAP